MRIGPFILRFVDALRPRVVIATVELLLRQVQPWFVLAIAR